MSLTKALPTPLFELDLLYYVWSLPLEVPITAIVIIIADVIECYFINHYVSVC